MEMLQQIFETCIIPLLGVLTAYLVAFVSKKTNEIKEKTNNDLVNKYVDLLSQTITDCVIATNQTYVDSLKNKEAFTIEAQQEAFAKTYNAVISTLTEEATIYLTQAYGDLTAYITTKIEAEVKLNK